MHVLADIAQIEGLQVAEMVVVKHYQDSHHLTVGEPAQTVTGTLTGDSNRAFSLFGPRNLQNSSILQKIFIKFAGVIGVDVLCTV